MRISWFLRHCWKEKKEKEGKQCKYLTGKEYYNEDGEQSIRYACKYTGKLIMGVKEAQKNCTCGIIFTDKEKTSRRKIIGMLRKG